MVAVTAGKRLQQRETDKESIPDGTQQKRDLLTSSENAKTRTRIKTG